MAKIRSTVITCDELVTLLNALHETDAQLTIGAPLWDLDLLRYDPRHGAVVEGVRQNTFEVKSKERRPPDERLARDAPTWADVRDALILSGLLGFPNAPEVAETIALECRIAGEARNPHPLAIGIDTNLLYLGVPHLPLLTRALERNPTVRLAFSAAVMAELDHAIGPKYKGGEIADLAATAIDPEVAEGFLGRSFRRGRKAKAAAALAQGAIKDGRALTVPAEGLGHDSEANDIVIAQSYGAWRRATTADVLFLTADNDMQQHALLAGLKVLHLQMPAARRIPTGPVEERTLAGLIHALAIAFGCVRVAGRAMRIWGDWSGKSPEDWVRKSLRLDYAGTPMMATFVRDIAAARAIEAIGRGAG
ncbi:MAG: hypothetical protein ACYDDF_00910 [Thermoplasmatota archaeon]